MKYFVDIDLNKNELVRAVVQNLPTHPTSPKQGQIYYNNDEHHLYCYIDSVWVALDLLYEHPTYAALNPNLSGANVLATLETNNEGHVIGATTRLLTLGDLGYTGDDNANYYTHPNFTGNTLSGAPLSGATVISDVSVNNQGHVTGFDTRDLTPADIGAAVINDSVTNAIDTWSSSKIQSEIDNINSQMVGGLMYMGGYDADNNIPNLTNPASGAVKKGYVYTVIEEGTFLGEAVQVGDVIISEVNDPSTIDDWTTVNKNIPDIVDATSTERGIIRLATMSEALGGTNNDAAITPATLVAFYNAMESESGYSASIGDNTSMTFDLTHGLDSKEVLVQCYEISSGDTVVMDSRRVSNSTVRIISNIAIGNNEIRVLIRKV